MRKLTARLFFALLVCVGLDFRAFAQQGGYPFSPSSPTGRGEALPAPMVYDPPPTGPVHVPGHVPNAPRYGPGTYDGENPRAQEIIKETYDWRARLRLSWRPDDHGCAANFHGASSFQEQWWFVFSSGRSFFGEPCRPQPRPAMPPYYQSGGVYETADGNQGRHGLRRKLGLGCNCGQ